MSYGKRANLSAKKKTELYDGAIPALSLEEEALGTGSVGTAEVDATSAAQLSY